MPFGQIPLSSPLKNPEPRRWIVITLKALPKKKLYTDGQTISRLSETLGLTKTLNNVHAI